MTASFVAFVIALSLLAAIFLPGDSKPKPKNADQELLDAMQKWHKHQSKR